VSELDGFRQRLADAVVLLDFDGSIAPIVRRPEEARPLPEAASVLGGSSGVSVRSGS
jgi:trehalose-6-phosphatase